MKQKPNWKLSLPREFLQLEGKRREISKIFSFMNKINGTKEIQLKLIR